MPSAGTIYHNSANSAPSPGPDWPIFLSLIFLSLIFLSLIFLSLIFLSLIFLSCQEKQTDRLIAPVR